MYNMYRSYWMNKCIVSLTANRPNVISLALDEVMALQR